MYGSQEKILGQKVNVKFFTVDTYSVGTGVPRTFLELGKILNFVFEKFILGKHQLDVWIAFDLGINLF